MSLKLANVSKRTDDRWILRDVSLEVQRGEVFGLLGADGSGRTALLQIIAGLEQPAGGEILFDGKDLTASKQRGFTFARRDDRLTWKDLFFKGGSKKTNLSEYARQRAVFEKNLAEAKSVLLLENPFSAYPLIERDRALETLRREAKENNLAVVFLTNDYEEAFAVCDRIGVLDGGGIAQVGTPRELYEKPGGAAVARSLGRNNFIEAKRVSFNNQTIQEFQTLTGEHRLQIGRAEKRALGAITDPVTLSIRPEHISISFGASFPEDNLLKAKIVAVIYQGATTRLKLDAGGLPLEALVLRLVGLNVGDECMVGLPPDRILVLR
jgi:ABC-type Fe3+/spermidine/putrescine transport system ATPase subunit